MKFISRLILISLIIFCCTSCIEIIEELNVKTGGHGNYRLTVNMSQSKTKLSTITKLDSIDGFKIPGKIQIDENLNELQSVLSNTKGINHVLMKRDHENFIYELAFEFENIEL